MHTSVRHGGLRCRWRLVPFRYAGLKCISSPVSGLQDLLHEGEYGSGILVLRTSWHSDGSERAERLAGAAPQLDLRSGGRHLTYEFSDTFSNVQHLVISGRNHHVNVTVGFLAVVNALSQAGRGHPYASPTSNRIPDRPVQSMPTASTSTACSLLPLKWNRLTTSSTLCRPAFTSG